MAVSTEEEARYLSEVDVLEPLSKEELDELARRVPDVNLAKGEFLHSPKERGEGIWLLKKGRVRVYRVDPGGGEFTLEVVREGTVRWAYRARGAYGPRCGGRTRRVRRHGRRPPGDRPGHALRRAVRAGAARRVGSAAGEDPAPGAVVR